MKTKWALVGVLTCLGCNFAAALAGNGGSFDHLTDADRQVFQERFTKEIWPIMSRGEKKLCAGCHGPGGKVVSALKLTGDPAKDFRMLVKEGFFIPDDSGSILTRVTSKDKQHRMPPPGKADPLSREDIEVLQKFVADLDKKQQKKK